MNEFNEKFPEKEYKKMTFSLNKEEQYRLTTLDTISQNGKLAEVMLNSFLQGNCLARVGVKNSQDVGIEYDLSNGTFLVYVPRTLCDMCKARKGVIFNADEKNPKEGKYYCETCMKVINTSKIK